MGKAWGAWAAALVVGSAWPGAAGAVSFAVNDTGQSVCYNDRGDVMTCPPSDQRFYGQDAQYTTNTPSFTLIDDVIAQDNNTGLMWQKGHNATKASYTDAQSACSALELGGYTDWRLPTIKELFSIVNFAGTVDDDTSTSPSNPYVFGDSFDIAYDLDETQTGTHTPQMMGQTWSATPRPDDAGSNYFMNFLDGHLKSQSNTNPDSTLFYRCVRGTEGVFENAFVDNGDSTVTDNATGLMWQQSNAEESSGDYQFSWEAALNSCESLSLGGYDDWRLPDVKELHSLVDYTNASQSIDTTVFTHNVDTVATGPFFWSSTTDEEFPGYANYVCFGPCWNYTFTADIHGPGAQRSDPKFDDGNLPVSAGDQEDRVQANNYVRCVRTAGTAGTAAASFGDVATDYWAHDSIEAIYGAGITQGCGDGDYCPDRNVTRAEMAIFLLRGINGASYAPPDASGTVFNDVTADYWAASWIEEFYALGITSGCGEGNYCPDREITRAEMAIFLLRVLHNSSYLPPDATGTLFADVASDYWASAWIEQLYADGITQGCGDGNYCTDRSVTRAEMAVFLTRTFGL